MTAIVPSRQLLRHLRRICSVTDIPKSSNLSAKRLLCTRPQSIRGILSTIPSGSRNFSSTSTTHAQSTPPPTNNNTSTDTNSPSPLPDITNYYTLFPQTIPSGPPPKGPFAIPVPQLRQEFLRLQSQHHPDKYTSSPTSHSKSLALSSLLNSAYKTLCDPLLRARYLLLHTYNIDITNEDNSLHRNVTDQATLMEVMEAQEATEEAETQEEIDALKSENEIRIKEAEQKLAKAFESENIEAAKTECVRLNYWRSLQQGLHDWEPGKEVRLIH